jgi:PIN domain
LKTQIILIDFENVQPANLAALRGRDFKIKVFLGPRQTKLPTDTVLGLHPLGSNAEYICVAGGGPNALDFHIAYYIGRLAVECPGAEFHIISRDSGFDPLIKHLAAQNIACRRSPSLEDIHERKPAISEAPLEWLEKVQYSLSRLGASKPARLKTLSSTIKAVLGNGTTDEQIKELIDQLVRSQTLSVTNGKVSYASD